VYHPHPSRSALQQGGADFAQHLVRQVVGQVDAGDRGAERAGDPVGLDITILRIPHDIHLVASSLALGRAVVGAPLAGPSRQSPSGR
jgi:hypothetical protein